MIYIFLPLVHPTRGSSSTRDRAILREIFVRKWEGKNISSIEGSNTIRSTGILREIERGKKEVRNVLRGLDIGWPWIHIFFTISYPIKGPTATQGRGILS